MLTEPHRPVYRGRPSWLPPYTRAPGGWRRIGWNNVPYHDGRTVFLINPKCANSAIKSALLVAQGHDGRQMHRNSTTWSPRQVADSGYRAIAVVRNPYARAVSIWQSKIMRGGRSGLTRFRGIEHGQSFLDFLRAVQHVGDYPEQHVRAQWVGMVHGRRFLPEQVFKLEDPGFWEEIRRNLPGLPPLVPRNESGAPAWQELCTGEARELILRRWGRDFDVFGYET